MSAEERAVSLRKALAQVFNSGTYKLGKLDLMLEAALREQDKLTRHACAEEVLYSITDSSYEVEAVVNENHRIIMNCNGGVK